MLLSSLKVTSFPFHSRCTALIIPLNCYDFSRTIEPNIAIPRRKDSAMPLL
uniref:Uncharacterized protein n=1 Tax=Anguilla anguilla TaxID=7936 RepID=A0A0E9UIX0_ANGAN